jgi:galactose-6-phosphate isomerase
MPLLDVSDVLCDPMFSEVLTIQRREAVVGSNGRSTIQTTTISPAPVGVVIPQTDQPLQRGPDQQNLPKLIQVHTTFRLRSASTDPTTGNEYQPDLIVWRGDSFQVNRVYDYSDFGAGFVTADCSSVDSLDVAAQ